MSWPFSITPGRLQGRTSSDEGGGAVFSYPMFRALQADQTVFTGLAGAREQSGSFAYGDQATLGRVHLVSGNYFSVLGVRPALAGVSPDQAEAAMNVLYRAQLAQDIALLQAPADEFLERFSAKQLVLKPGDVTRRSTAAVLSRAVRGDGTGVWAVSGTAVLATGPGRAAPRRRVVPQISGHGADGGVGAVARDGRPLWADVRKPNRGRARSPSGTTGELRGHAEAEWLHR